LGAALTPSLGIAHRQRERIRGKSASEERHMHIDATPPC